ncbi:MAG: M10 family metallopeptidase domain-containing protein [Chloroflexota bacterium]|nr:M10 family metallopeptidase domain-containing protein [Chloroflexota bacterium]
MDMLTGGVHEFGHSLLLHDDPPGHMEAVMYNTCTAKRELQEDDKHGATMLYGVRTGWEPGFAEGQHHRIAPNLALIVTGYFAGLNPELSPVTNVNEFGVMPYGSRMSRMAGRSLNSHSYVYFTLFTGEDDTGVDQNWLTIKPGMRLKWVQYNYQQSPMSVDLRLRDPRGNIRYIRDDSRIVDQSRIRVHPAARGNYPTGQWLFFDVDLSQLGYEDLRIDRWMLAYDNGNNGYADQFRAYFDNLRVEY